MLGGQGSQMKQIKGGLWPPRETLADYRDGIQMEDHVRGIQETAGLLLVSLSVFSLSHCLGRKKPNADVACPVSQRWASR